MEFDTEELILLLLNPESESYTFGVALLAPLLNSKLDN